MKHPGFLKTYEETKEWLDEKCINLHNLIIHDDLTISVKDVDIILNRRSDIINPKYNSHNILVKFRTIERVCRIFSSKINTLYGLPEISNCGVYIERPAPLLKTFEYLPEKSNLKIYKDNNYTITDSNEHNARMYLNWLLKFSPDISYSLRYLNKTNLELFKYVLAYSIKNNIILPVEEDYINIASAELTRMNHRM